MITRVLKESNILMWYCQENEMVMDKVWERIKISLILQLAYVRVAVKSFPQ